MAIIDMDFRNIEQDPLGFQIKEFRFTWSDTWVPGAFNEKGDYIGNVDFAQFLYKRGIKPIKRTKDSNVCSIGFCEKEQKWYGWSHRAMGGFGVGDEMFGEETIIQNLDEAELSARKFAESVS